MTPREDHHFQVAMEINTTVGTVATIRRINHIVRFIPKFGSNGFLTYRCKVLTVMIYL